MLSIEPARKALEIIGLVKDGERAFELSSKCRQQNDGKDVDGWIYSESLWQEQAATGLE
jgi:hypothetical protein